MNKVDFTCWTEDYNEGHAYSINAYCAESAARIAADRAHSDSAGEVGDTQVVHVVFAGVARVFDITTDWSPNFYETEREP